MFRVNMFQRNMFHQNMFVNALFARFMAGCVIYAVLPARYSRKSLAFVAGSRRIKGEGGGGGGGGIDPLRPPFSPQDFPIYLFKKALKLTCAVIHSTCTCFSLGLHACDVSAASRDGCLAVLRFLLFYAI